MPRSSLSATLTRPPFRRSFLKIMFLPTVSSIISFLEIIYPKTDVLLKNLSLHSIFILFSPYHLSRENPFYNCSSSRNVNFLLLSFLPLQKKKDGIKMSNETHSHGQLWGKCSGEAMAFLEVPASRYVVRPCF